jgi:hypothetical protein
MSVLLPVPDLIPHWLAHYNREVYPRPCWNWEHTYICRRCGKFRLVPF